MKNFLNQVLSREVTGFNVFSKELDDDKQKAVIYGHTTKSHLHLVLSELEKSNLSVPYLIIPRQTVYLWKSEWVASSNTRIITMKEKFIAIESGYLIAFFPPRNSEKSLIDFLIWGGHNCDGKDCLDGSWQVPYLATKNIQHPEFISTKEIVLKGNDGTIQSSFVPDKFKEHRTEIREKFLFRPFADFVHSTV